jgi:hypothetical protein
MICPEGLQLGTDFGNWPACLECQLNKVYKECKKQHYSCYSKVGLSEGSAIYLAKKLAGSHYKCPYCLDWHVSTRSFPGVDNY